MTYAEQLRIQQNIIGARLALAYLADEAPDITTTPGQEKLRKRHGTPRTFAIAVINSVGTISNHEAKVAIQKYVKEWNEA